MNELTTGEGATRVLVDEMVLGSGHGIEAQEARGKKLLTNSELLPVQILHSTEDDFIKLGFIFGEPLEDDPLFRPTQLPEGWSKTQGPNHDMWSCVCDETGTERISVFYKAAFYDRRAHMSIRHLDGQ